MSLSQLRERARRHWQSDLTRSGYALLLSSMFTSGLGLAYWFGAARLFAPPTWVEAQRWSRPCFW